MIAANVRELDLNTLQSMEDPSFEVSFDFPIFAAKGSRETAVVYFELAPGKRLGRHTDSAEEILYFVEGEGEAEVGGEWVSVRAGTLAVIPALQPHQVRNTGSSTIKVVGFFAGSAVVSHFEEGAIPGTEQVVIVTGPSGQDLYNASPLVPAAAPA
jgi:quercetin dioxygenase-like cupin family protein